MDRGQALQSTVNHCVDPEHMSRDYTEFIMQGLLIAQCLTEGQGKIAQCLSEGQGKIAQCLSEGQGKIAQCLSEGQGKIA